MVVAILASQGDDPSPLIKLCHGSFAGVFASDVRHCDVCARARVARVVSMDNHWSKQKNAVFLATTIVVYYRYFRHSVAP